MSAETRVATIGIIGAGRIGQAFARTARRAGRAVVLSNSRGPESLAPVVAALGTGVSTGTTGEAAGRRRSSSRCPGRAFPRRSSGWPGAARSSSTQPTRLSSVTPLTCSRAALDGRSSSEIVAELVAGARVVKAANTLPAELLGADPRDAGGRRVLFLSGDDGDAKAEVAALFEAAGFSSIDRGDLATGGRLQQPGGFLSGHNLVQLP